MKIKKRLIEEAHLLGNELNHFDEDLEVSDFEADEMLEEFEEHAERFQRTKGILKGRATAQKVMQRKYGNRFNAALKKAKNRAALRSSKGIVVGAYVNLVVKRVSNNINSPLPVALFGTTFEASQYKQLLSEFMPSGVTIVKLEITSTGGFVFTYSNGTITDTITVECPQIPYSNFVRALQTDQFDVNKLRYSLADPVTMLPQFQEPFQYYKKSLFGTKTVKDFPIEMHKTPMQQQNGILDIDMSFDVDKDTALICYVAKLNNVLSQFNLNLFIPNYFKYNAKSVMG